MRAIDPQIGESEHRLVVQLMPGGGFESSPEPSFIGCTELAITRDGPTYRVSVP